MSAAPGRTRRELVMSGITLGLIALGVLLFVGMFAGILGRGAPSLSRERVGLVEVTGVIADPDPVTRQLRYFVETARVPVILLRIDSPGGSVGAAQEIYRQVQITRQRGVKVVASMGNVAASGGYYVAIAADSIMANPGTLTGSIGVIAEFPEVDTLLHKLGIGFNVITSGKYKDTGSPFRPMRAADEQLLRGVIRDTYEQFVEAVSAARHIPRARLDSLAQGQVMTGRQAKARGLIDTLGNYDDALRLARRMGGLGASARLVRAPAAPKGLLQRLLDGASGLRHAPNVSVQYLMP